MKAIKENPKNTIIEIATKLAEHDLLDGYGISIDALYDETGNYLPGYQKEFDVYFDEHFNLLFNLIN